MVVFEVIISKPMTLNSQVRKILLKCEKTLKFELFQHIITKVLKIIHFCHIISQKPNDI